MTDQPTNESVTEALKTVLDPEIGKDLVTLDMIKGIEIKGSNVSVAVELPTPACPLKDRIKADVQKAVTGVSGVGRVDVDFSARVRGASSGSDDPLPGVKNTIAIASGKGGVGKSTVAVNLAMALVEEGAKVGLLDCDIYGPSVPLMTGSAGVQPEAGEDGFLPVVRHGLKLMSIGYLVPPDQSVVWRGPLIHKAVQQFIQDVVWGELDYLLIDLPPGTGDAQLSLSQTIPLTGVVMVTTPQEISLIDVRKGADMFEKVSVPMIGVVENMSYFACPACGEQTEIFFRGGGQKVAKELDTPFLGELPIDPAVRESGDGGIPVVVNKKDSTSAQAFYSVARELAGRVSQLNLAGGLGFKQELPTIK